MSTCFKPIKTGSRLELNAGQAERAFRRAQDLIQNRGLITQWQALPVEGESRFVMGELSFGVGLHFLVAWSIWDRVAPVGARLHFISAESSPLSLTDLKHILAQWPELAVYSQRLMDTYPVLTPGYHRLVFEKGRITLDLMLGDVESSYQDRLLCGDPILESTLRHDEVDAWLVDDNSPISAKLSATMALLSRHAASSIERCIQRITPWHVSSTQRFIKMRHAIVVGAGLAGCFMAYHLAHRGWRVSLLDQNSTVGKGASGNRHAILFPNMSAYCAPLTELMLSGFLYASDMYQAMMTRWPIGDLSGILQFIPTQKSDQTQIDLAKWLLAYPELGEWMDAQRASTLTGVNVTQSGLFIPRAGWIDSPALCEHLIHSSSIDFYPHTDVQSLNKTSEGWEVAGHQAETAILASGYLVNRFRQTQHLKMKTIRGQMTDVKSNEKSSHLSIPVCGQGHILPSKNGLHAIGATFGLASQDARCLAEEDEINCSKINSLPLKLDLSFSISSSWAGIRGAALDHLPLVGPVVDALQFTQQFRSLSSNSRKWIASGAPVLPGLYIAAGFGSRGITTIPLCTEYLAGLINREPSNLPQRLVRAISPARFLHRDILQGKT